jgi:hypothetical protein
MTSSKVRPRHVVRAVDELIAQHGLPVILTFNDVAEQIVTGEMLDAGIDRVPKAMRERAVARVRDELIAAGLLKSACEHHARSSTLPFTLVTQYFLDYIPCDSTDMLDEALSDMTEEEVKRSLPAKPFFHVNEDGTVNRDIMYAGEHCAALFAKTGSRYPIILRNEQRHFKRSAEGIKTLGSRSERVLPERKSVPLKGALAGASGALLRQAKTPPLAITKS